MLQDRNIHGKYISSKNKPLFLGFIEYSGMHLLNKTHAPGKPTYEILKKRKSIIDFALASSLKPVYDFRVLPDILGTSIQICHKIFLLTLKPFSKEVAQQASKQDNHNVRQMFKFCSHDRLLEVRQRVLSKLRSINEIRLLVGRQMHPTYTVFLKLYFTAKVKHIGYRGKHKVSSHLSQNLEDLQNRILASSNVFQKTKSQLSLFLLQQLEKLLQEKYKSDMAGQFHEWLSKLNTLDYKGRTRENFLDT